MTNRRRVVLNKDIERILQAIVALCNRAHNITPKEARDFIESVHLRLYELIKLAKREENASLTTNMGYYMLVRVLSGLITTSDWVEGYNTAIQRHVIREQPYGYLHLNLMMVCFYGIYQLVLQGPQQFDYNMFHFNLLHVNCTETNSAVSKESLESEPVLNAQYQKSAYLLLQVIGISVSDLSSYTVICQICLEPVAACVISDSGNVMKVGLVLSCGHICCNECRSKITHCPTCRAILQVQVDRRVITGSYMRPLNTPAPSASNPSASSAPVPSAPPIELLNMRFRMMDTNR